MGSFRPARSVPGPWDRAPRPRRGRRLAPTAAGVVLVWGALGALGYIGGWQLHAKRAGSALVRAEGALDRPAGATRGPRSCVVSGAMTGQLAGVLRIPSLGLTAPVEEGTADPVLSVAVGHDPSSVWPGAAGTSVLMAHDVSYFVHIGELKPGDVIEYRTVCSTARFTVTTSQVVPQGSPIAGSQGSALVLDTCYPPNALFFTSERLLVWAVSSGITQSGPIAAGERSSGTVAASAGPSYSVPAPAALVAQGLTLEQNDAPMGTMTLVGRPAPGWEQSPGPMALEAAALEAYFGGIHAAAATEASWWTALTEPGIGIPCALAGGADITGHDAPLDVEIVSALGEPNEVVLTTTVTVSGGDAPGTYDETVTADVNGSTVLLGGWTLDAV
jgi:sortase A